MRRALLALALFAHAARADDLPRDLPRERTSPYPLAPVRMYELNAAVALISDWNGRTDRPDGAGSARPSALVSGEVMFGRERLRAGLAFGVELGRWGDDRHGWVSMVPGARVRSSFVVDDLVELYLVGRLDFPISVPVVDGSVSGVGLRPAIGLGFRALRGVAIEVTYDPVFALTERFASTESADVAHGMGIALSFNPCVFGCAPPKRPRVHRDLACRLYQSAAGVGMCKEARAAMDAVPDPLAPPTCSSLAELDAKRMEDGVSAFLAKLESIAGDVDKPKARALAKMHCDLLALYWRYEQKRAAHALAKLELDETWSYAPTPVELRDAFGCDPAGDAVCAPPICSETHEDP